MFDENYIQQFLFGSIWSHNKYLNNCFVFFFSDEASNPDREPDYEDYLESSGQYLKREPGEPIPGLDLSDPKQLAEFARLSIVNPV